MCLTKQHETPEDWGEYGWKVFRKDSDGIHPQYRGKYSKYPIGIWLREKDRRYTNLLGSRILDSNSCGYDTGFHFFKTEKAADRWSVRGRAGPPQDLVVRKVRVRGVHTTGYQSLWGRQNTTHLKTGVANQMMILP